MEKHYEMQWDCQFCGTKKLLGKTHRFCPNCGAPQNPDARYFPSDEEKVAVEDHEFVGKDQICPACGGLNAGDANNCGNCGAPLNEAARAHTLQAQSKAAGEAFESSGSRDVDQERFEREMAAAGIETPAAKASQDEKSGGVPKWLIGIGIAAVLVCGAVFFLFSRTQATTVIAIEHNWEREIQIEEYQRVRGEDWQDSVPIGAYNERCTIRQRDTRRVPDGETCRTERRDNGDGTFTEREVCEPKYREEAVMDDWCTYDIDKWEYERSIVTDGTGVSPAPEWGAVNFSCTGTRLGCERESDREERYTVIFRDSEGETYTCPFPQSEWENIAVESRWNLEVRQFVGGAACNTLAPATG